MRQQGNMFQTKKQDKTPEVELREMEIGNLLEKAFMVIIVKMIKELGRRMDEPCKKLEVSKKELESITNQRAEEYNNCN